MAKISTTDETNKYFKLINGYIDDYIHDWKISPSALKKYFSNKAKYESFIKKYSLEDIENIKIIFDDVIDDRQHIENDGVMKFESFINEDMGSISIKRSGHTHERILADLYHTSLGHISKTSETDHKYSVSDFGEVTDVIIYSTEDINEFKTSIMPIFIKNINESQIDIHKLNVGLSSGKEVKTGISLSVSDIVDNEKLKSFINLKLDKRKILEIIHSFINDYDILKMNKNYIYKKEVNGHHIWELKEKPTLKKVKN